MRIRRIEIADFRSNELTMFQTFKQQNAKFIATLRSDDVVVFIAKSGNQLLFIHGLTSFLDANNDNTPRLAIMSVRHRLLGNSCWNPLRLANYAQEAGLQVEGLKLFEEHLKQQLKK